MRYFKSKAEILLTLLGLTVIALSQLDCGWGEDIPPDIYNVHPTEWKDRFRVLWETKWKYIGCSFPVKVEAILPPEYAHYENAEHLLKVLGDSGQVRAAYGQWDKLQVNIPCGMCAAKDLSGGILVKDGGRLVYWGEGDGTVWPPLLVSKVTASFDYEESFYTTTSYRPLIEQRDDINYGRTLLFDLDPACVVLRQFALSGIDPSTN